MARREYGDREPQALRADGREPMGAREMSPLTATPPKNPNTKVPCAAENMPLCRQKNGTWVSFASHFNGSAGSTQSMRAPSACAGTPGFSKVI